VFAGRDFREGELIESAPVIVIPAAQWPLLEHTVLHDYMYAYGPTLDDMAIALGFGSLYNHSYEPNARYVRRTGEGLLEFIAIRPIRRGEEITINYNGSPDEHSPVWFSVCE
jgi:hypothetical protein